MLIEYTDCDIILKNVISFDLEQTLDCGQCFRWNKISADTYSGVAYGKYLKISQNGDTVTFHNCCKADFENIWFSYFDLGTDYECIKENLAQIHPILNEAQKYAPGIRILKQEPWEALCSFIISQNNNIPRIKGIIKRLCEHLRSGFRAKYIADACQKVSCGEVDLAKIEKMSVTEARTELIKIKGVGQKVADCTMLYGMGKKECFPLDVWMKRAMKILFPELTPESFGENAGIAQQYIFHYSRMHPELFGK